MPFKYNPITNQLDIVGASSGPGSGTVTSVSVVSANGLAGTVANPTTTPAITLSTTSTGVLSGNGTNISGSPVTQHSVLVGGPANFVTSLPVGNTGEVLTGVSGSDPVFASPAASSITFTGDLGTPFSGADLTLTGGLSGLTFTASSPDLTLGGILAIANGGTAVSSVTIAPTASSWAGWDASSNLSANSFLAGYATTVTAASLTTLTAASPELQYFTGSTTQAVKMPATISLALGQSFTIVNNSTGVVSVESSGTNPIQAMASGTQLVLTCINRGVTTASGWSTSYTGASGGGGITTINGDSGSITGDPVTIEAGVSTFNCGSSVSFVNSASTSTLNVLDGFQNTVVGQGSGQVGSSTFIANVAFGPNILATSTTIIGGQQNNIVFGVNNLNYGADNTNNYVFGSQNLNSPSLLSPNNNIIIGSNILSTNSALGPSENIIIDSGFDQAAYLWGGYESNNILISTNSNSGKLGDMQVIYIGYGYGPTPYMSACFIDGIRGVSVTGGAAVLADANGQLGTIVSSERYKENIQYIGADSEVIYKLRPVKFTLKAHPEYGQHTGLIAEEVQKVAPSLVILNREGQPDSVAYHELPTLLLAEIQKLNARIAALEAK